MIVKCKQIVKAAHKRFKSVYADILDQPLLEYFCQKFLVFERISSNKNTPDFA